MTDQVKASLDFINEMTAQLKVDRQTHTALIQAIKNVTDTIKNGDEAIGELAKLKAELEKTKMNSKPHTAPRSVQ